MEAILKKAMSCTAGGAGDFEPGRVNGDKMARAKEYKYMANKILPKRIIGGDILLYKISHKEDNIFKELLVLYKANREHLSHWHHGYKELLFKIINDIKNHLKKNKLMCYIIYKQNKIIGCIEVGRAAKTDDKLKCRTLSYWINKDNARKGIMYNCLSLLERSLWFRHFNRNVV
jgi:hypothetical protein